MISLWVRACARIQDEQDQQDEENDSKESKVPKHDRRSIMCVAANNEIIFSLTRAKSSFTCVPLKHHDQGRVTVTFFQNFLLFFVEG